MSSARSLRPNKIGLTEISIGPKVNQRPIFVCEKAEPDQRVLLNGYKYNPSTYTSNFVFSKIDGE